MSAPLEIRGLSHVCIRVSDVERSLAFYRDALGLALIFDVTLEGEALAAVSGGAGARGRMVGCLVPGSRVTIELLCFAGDESSPPVRQPRPALGYTNLALAVSDLDAAHARLAARGLRGLGPCVEVGGVRMFFVLDPDGTPLEILQFPNGALSSAEHNGA